MPTFRVEMTIDSANDVRYIITSMYSRYIL